MAPDRLIATMPTATVAHEQPDLVSGLNHSGSASRPEAASLGTDEMFLIHVAGAWPEPRLWTRVRLAPSCDLARVLGPQSGNPGFVTLSMSGDGTVRGTV